MANIGGNVIPTRTWKTINWDLQYNNQDYKMGLALYPEHLVFKTTDIVEGITYVDKYGNVFDTADYNIFFDLQFALSTYITEREIQHIGDPVGFYNWTGTDSTRERVARAFCQEYGGGIATVGSYKDQYIIYVDNPQNAFFDYMTPESLGKIDNLTDGYFPFTGFAPTSTQDITRQLWTNFIQQVQSQLQGYVYISVQEPNNYITGLVGSTKWKLPILFTPIISINSNGASCIYLGVEPK